MLNGDDEGDEAAVAAMTGVDVVEVGLLAMTRGDDGCGTSDDDDDERGEPPRGDDVSGNLSIDAAIFVIRKQRERAERNKAEKYRNEETRAADATPTCAAEATPAQAT